jgi:hypothetical protein
MRYAVSGRIRHTPLFVTYHDGFIEFSVLVNILHGVQPIRNRLLLGDSVYIMIKQVGKIKLDGDKCERCGHIWVPGVYDKNIDPVRS